MTDKAKLLALVRFDREYLQPRVANYSGYETALRCFTLCELFEAYFWIALGVAIGTFNQEDARLLVRHRFIAPFHDFPALFRDWAYLLDSQLVDLFNIAKAQNEFFENTALAEFEQPQELIPWFQSAFRMQQRFASTSARVLLSRLNFNPRTIFQLLRYEGSLTPAFDVDKEEIFKGFVESVEYMGDFRQFYTDLLENESIVEHDRFLFRRRFKQVQMWRLNFTIKTTEEAFLIMSGRAAEFLPGDAARFGLVPDPASIKGATLDLMTEWGYQQAMSA